LKSKIKNLFNFKRKKFSVFFSVFLVTAVLFPVFKYANAESFPANNVTLTTDIEVSGKKDNLVRMLKSGKANFSVILTVSKALNASGTQVSEINLLNGANYDVFDFGIRLFSDRPIVDLGVGLELEGTNNTCSLRTLSGIIPGFSNASFNYCTFPGGTNKLSALTGSKIVKVGQQYKINFELNEQNLNKLKLLPASGSTGNFVVYPYFDIQIIGAGVKDIAYTAAPQKVFVQLFDTQADLDKAIAGNVRPSDVPAYGGAVSGNSSAISGGGSDPVTWLIKQIINGVLGIFQELIYAIFFYFVAPFIQAMLSIHPYTDTFVAVIYPGWEVVRNLCNMLFVIALVVIALATLFRIDSYQFKHLIVQLIIAALLINFSLVIAQAILALADTVQAQFLPANVTVIRSLAGNLMVNNWRDAFFTMGSPFTSNTNAGSLADVVQPLFFFSLSLGSFAVFCAIMVFLVIRIIALWILLLVSPIAYACGVLPATASYRATWWQYFIKYAFFTPIMAFFLNMTAVMANQYTSGGNPILKSLSDPAAIASLRNSDVAAFVFRLASNLLLLIFLVAGLKVADAAGVFGAHGITAIAQNGILAPFAGAGMLAKSGADWLQRVKRDKTASWSQEHDKDGKHNPLYKKIAFAALNPDAVVKAFKKDSEKNMERAEHFAEAAAIDLKRQTPGFREPGLASEYAEAQLHYIDQLDKERPYSGNESLAVAEALKTTKLAQTQDKQKANFSRQLLQLTENKGLNTFMYYYKGKNGESFEYTPEGINAMMVDLVKQNIISNQMAGELRSRMSKIGYESGSTVLYEGTNYHEGSVHPILFDTEQITEADGKKRWVIVGKNEYEKIENEAYQKMDKDVNTNAKVKEEIAELIPEGADATMIENITNDYRKKLFEKYKEKGIEHELHHQHEKGDHSLENYVHWVSSLNEKNSNITKAKNPNETFTSTHWNSIGAEVSGKYELQDATMVQLKNIDAGTYFGLGRGQVQEKILETITYALKDRDRVVKQRAEFSKRTDMLSGKKLKDPNQYIKEAKAWAILLDGASKAKQYSAPKAQAITAQALKDAGLFDEKDHAWLLSNTTKEEKK
jgi:hypothetical protein